MDIAIVVPLVALLLAALMTGALIINWIGLARAMAQMSSAAYTEFHQATNRTFDPYMPIVGFGAIAGGVALAEISSGRHPESGFWLAIAGTLCYTIVIVISLSTNVPINKAIANWSIQSPPDNWKDIRAEWIRWHILRTVVSIPALLCYLLSVLLAGR